MTLLAVATRNVFACRCGLTFFTALGQGKPPEISDHQQHCTVAPGDTVPQPEPHIGHLGPDLIIFMAPATAVWYPQRILTWVGSGG